MIVVDLETSGFDGKINSILSIGAVNFDIPENTFYEECTLFPGAVISDNSLSVNGFSEEEIQIGKKQSEAELINKFNTWVEEQNQIGKTKHLIAGQYISFDISFLRSACERAGIPYMFPRHFVDLHSIAYAYFFNKGEVVSEMKLDDILQKLGLNPESKPHIALNGARLEYKAFKKLFDLQKENISLI